ncbi:MAG: hypothetical protein HWN66_04010 [Candidatus Helarchaeota archaeon]|nr:hypothetical protein [Candidatus Helarchaeota archaeon]
MFQFPCEIIVRDILPAFKAFIVKELYHKYQISQSRIATILDITQASVSYYLHGERGSTGSELIQKNDKIKQLLLSITKDIAKGSSKPEDVVNQICTLCYSMHEEFGCKAQPSR